jgi:uncharacterized protein (DUF305 family)
MTATAPGSSSTGELNDTEVVFLQGMIAHHEQAIEMAEIALDPSRGAGTEILDLATRIRSAQDPEVDLMMSMLTSAGAPMEMDMSDGHDMSSMEGMMSAEEMDSMATMMSVEFDRVWLEMMIEHHRGAISQSEDVKVGGSNPAVLALANQIITTQTAEIDEMGALLKS